MPKSAPIDLASSTPTTMRRAFKNKWFSKQAAKRGITDQELCKALAEVQRGQADDLGGGVWKKRLNDNLDRSIVLAKGGHYWIFVYLFQKKDRENIEEDELAGFKKLAKAYEQLTAALLRRAIASRELTEICHE